MSSFLGFCEGDTRNRWRDGQVCPDVDKELWRLGPDGSGVFLACYAPIRRRRREKKKRKTRKRENGQEKKDKESSGRENGRKEEERRKREGDGKSLKESRGERRKPALNGEKKADSGNWSEKDYERRWR
ncbi:hypothetical protein TNCV_3127771 [Trichonephila clavipes]|nr:hypothetical protein TNCV_3127771 [Trichonephila clavipes]